MAGMTPTLMVAMVQCPYGEDVTTLVRSAAETGADIVVFPEMYSNGYATFDPDDPAAEARWCAGAVPVDGDYVERFRAAARRHGLHVVATLLEAGDPAPFNCALLIGPDGRTVLKHRKVHTCHFDTPERACGRGETFDVAQIETRAGPVTVGMMICMDREYADSAPRLSARGAEIALVPNCCDLATDPVVGDVRQAGVRGRAFETVMAMAVASYPAPKCDGHSFAVDPLGRIVAEAGTGPEILIAEFNLSAIFEARKTEWYRWRDTD